MMKKLTSVSLSVLSLAMVTAEAGTVRIKPGDADALNRKIASLAPGDTLVIQNGTYRNFAIDVPGRVDGTQRRPITIRAEDDGKVRLVGNSRLSIGGDFVTVRGLNFAGGKTTDGPVIRFQSGRSKARRSRVTETAIHAVRSEDRRGRGAYYVLVTGTQNQVDRSSFYGKPTSGPVIHIENAASSERIAKAEGNHTITKNWIGFTPSGSNAHTPCVRIGPSSFADIDARNVVSFNLLEECDAGYDALYVQGAGNEISQNTLLRSRGRINLRSGGRNTVHRNAILAGGDPRVGGIRVSGEDHIVTENYLGEVPRGLEVMMGDAANETHPRVEDAVIARNTFYLNDEINFETLFDNRARGAKVPCRVAFDDNVVLHRQSKSTDDFKIVGGGLIDENDSFAINGADGGWRALDQFTTHVATSPNGLHRASNPRARGAGAPTDDMYVMRRSNRSTGASWYDKPSSAPR